MEAPKVGDYLIDNDDGKSYVMDSISTFGDGETAYHLKGYTKSYAYLRLAELNKHFHKPGGKTDEYAGCKVIAAKDGWVWRDNLEGNKV